MRKIFLFAVLFVALLFFSRCGSRENFRIEGKFQITDPTPVLLYYLSESEAILKDSLFTNTGSFVFKNKAQFSGIYLMKFFNDQQIYLVIHPGDHIKIDIDNSKSEISYYVEDSYDSKRVKELTDRQRILLKNIDQLSRELESNREDTEVRARVDSVYHELMMKHRNFTVEFIHENPQSLANILALYQNFGRKTQPLFDKYDDIGIFDFVDSTLVVKYPETDAVKALNKEVNEVKGHMKQKSYIEKVVGEGHSFPPFNYAAINGDTVTLNSDLRKTMVLFFWATWNTYSTEELKKLNDYVRGRKAGMYRLQQFHSTPHLKS